jgi:uncharacterized membrane protein YhaH (DUF805 family)
MKGKILHYDDNAGTGQISGDDGIRYNFTRADLKQLIPIRAGTVVDFDFDGRSAKDIYVASAMPGVRSTGTSEAYYGDVEPDLGLWGYFKRCMTSYFAKFSGRARRKEYWGFALFTFLINIVLQVIFFIAAGPMMMAGDPNAMANLSGPAMIVGVILIIFGLVLLIPSLAVLVRRFHDIGWSGWILLLFIVGMLIPFLNFLIVIGLIVVLCIDSQRNENKWGPPPKAF